MIHIPVLKKEVLGSLDPRPNENFIDCTLGEGGHTLAILEKIAPRGKVLGIDYQLRIRPQKRLILSEDNFANLKNIVKGCGFGPVHGILFDLGYSSWHLEESGRGFSFRKKEPLDMRYDLKHKLTAEKIISYYSKFEIEKILTEYGEEKKAGKIAEKIVESRAAKPIKNTLQLAGVIRMVGVAPHRTFQALRITVNNELGNLEKALPQALDILEDKGRLAVISFHSLEDKIVKQFCKEKPIMPGSGEIKINPRARSAKMRVCQKK